LSTLDENHIDVATSHDRLASVYSNLGEYAKAKKHYEEALNIKLKNFGESHIEVVKSLNDLSKVHHDLGEYKTAENHAQKALNIQLKNPSENHIDIANSYNNLASVYRTLEDYEKAEKYLKKAVDFYLKDYNKNPNVVAYLGLAYSYSDLGMVYIVLENFEKAKEYLEGATEMTLKAEGEYNIRTADSYSNLAIVYNALGDYEKAKNYNTKALNIRIQKLGENHLSAATSYNDLATTYNALGNYEKAKNYNEKALNIRIQKLGENHLDVATSYFNLAMVYQTLDDHEKAKNYLKKTLNIQLKNLGENHAVTAISYNKLASVCYALEDYDTAKIYTDKALNIQLNNFGENSIQVTDSYHMLASFYQMSGNYETAREYNEKALNITIKKLDENHIRVANSYHILASFYQTIGDHETSIEYNEKALNIKIEKLGKNHIEVASLYNNLSLGYYSLGDFDSAKIYLEEAIKINLKHLDENHIKVATSYNNLAYFHRATGNYKTAKNYCEKALNIKIEKLGKNHIEIAHSYNDLALTYCYLGDYEKAKSYLNQSLKITQSESNADSQYTIRLAVIYDNMNLHQQADSLWQIIIPESLEKLKKDYTFLPERQRVEYLNTVELTYLTFYLFAKNYQNNATNELALNLHLNTKSMALDYGINTRRFIEEINNDSLNNTLKQLNIINSQLAKADVMSGIEPQKLGWDLSEKRKERDRLSNQILRHPELRAKLNTETIEWQNIQNHLAPDETALDFLTIYEPKDSTWAYYGIIIRKDLPNPQFIRIADESKLYELLQVDNAECPIYIYDRRGRKALYKALWQPLQPHLKGIKTVHISPSSLLHYVPFESLQDEKNKYLVTKYDFHYYSAIRDMLKEKPQKTTYKDMLLMGHILYDLDKKDKYEEEKKAFVFKNTRNTSDSIRPLQGTLDEVMAIDTAGIQASLKTTLLTINAASEDTVQYFVREHAPSIMHFATHGVFLPPLGKRHQGLDLVGTRDRLRAADNPLQRSALMHSPPSKSPP